MYAKMFNVIIIIIIMLYTYKNVLCIRVLNITFARSLRVVQNAFGTSEEFLI